MTEHTNADLLDALGRFDYLNGLTDEMRAAVGEALEMVEVPAHEWLFHQGDLGHSMYVLFKGVMRVVRETREGAAIILDMIDPGSAVGELALLTGQPRSAGLQAVTDSALIRIPREVMTDLAEADPALREQIYALAVPRMQNTQMSGVLGRHFGDLDAETLSFLKQSLTWRHLPSGETLFAQGEEGDSMAIVVNGRLRIMQTGEDGTARILGEAGRGENVGEYTLLTEEPRSATVIAMRDSDVLMLDREGFARLSHAYPALVLKIAQDIARRARLDGRARSERDAALTFAVVPLSATVPVRDIALGLRRALSAQDSTLWLCAGEFDRRFERDAAAQTPPGDPFNLAIAGWMNQQEAAHRYVIYETDYGWTEWTQRCLRNADRVIMLADAGDDPMPGDLETNILAMDPRPSLDLILIQPDDAELPVGTAAWLDQRPPLEHHHLRLSSEVGFERLVRRLTGRATGLVLGGGAARGYAHIGVFAALQEAELAIDFYGGTSMGAVMAAGMARYGDVATITTLTGQYGSNKALLDLTLPTTAVYKSAKVTEMLQTVLGDVLIEDLWNPFFCVSSNLSRSEPVIHRRGLLWQAVRASLAIPGVFAPLSVDGDLLIDGGVMNNLPADVMRDLVGSGTVVAVNANPRREKSRTWNYGPSVSGWQVMRDRIVPGAHSPRVPSLVGTVLRAMAVNSTYQLQHMEELADLFIQLDTSDFGIMDWSAHQSLIELGYATAQGSVAAWLAREQQPQR